MDRMVRRYWCEPGRNSRKIAESTGRLPPTPMLHSAANVATAAKLGEPAEMSPKTAVMPIVRLNAHLEGSNMSDFRLCKTAGGER